MPEEGARLAQRLGCEFFETSAKTGWNVDNAFKSVVRGIRASKGLSGGVTPTSGGGAGVVSGIGNQPGNGAVGNGYAERKRKEKRHKRCTIL
jgi:GTPase KRas protein